MAAPSRRVGPSPVSVLLALLVAAVVGFLGGAVVALVGRPATDGTPSPTDATAGPTPVATPTAPSTGAATLTLTADRQQASTDELIRLTGRLDPPAAGVVLQVQQSVDGSDFTDFPVTATTRGDGSYGVWVRTGREGRNQFRVVTKLQDGAVDSAPVLVVVG